MCAYCLVQPYGSTAPWRGRQPERILFESIFADPALAPYSDKYEFVKKAKMIYFTFTLGMFFTKNNQEQIAVNLYSKVNYEME